jgi:hypothetical protein
LWEEALKDNTGGELILAHARALEQMQKASIVLKHQILDNLASAAYKKAIGDFNMTYKVVPTDESTQHGQKSHPYTQRPFCPMHLWCQLLPQVERQLLLLQQSQLHPDFSAYAHICGHHDYNKHPFVTIGMEALVHDKPHKCQTYL